jgi:hypothetical protein
MHTTNNILINNLNLQAGFLGYHLFKRIVCTCCDKKKIQKCLLCSPISRKVSFFLIFFFVVLEISSEKVDKDDIN